MNIISEDKNTEERIDITEPVIKDSAEEVHNTIEQMLSLENRETFKAMLFL